jgi:hypothetical protein
VLGNVNYILEVRGSNLEQDKEYSEAFHCFSQFLQEHVGMEGRSSGM